MLIQTELQRQNKRLCLQEFSFSNCLVAETAKKRASPLRGALFCAENAITS